jgi:hypothetical protein
MADIKNPEGVDAVIVLDGNGKLVMVVPNEFEIGKEETARWVVTGKYLTEIDFGSNRSPFNSKKKTNDNKGNIEEEITGLVLKSSKAGAYKYSVTVGADTIDPRLRVRS